MYALDLSKNDDDIFELKGQIIEETKVDLSHLAETDIKTIDFGGIRGFSWIATKEMMETLPKDRHYEFFNVPMTLAKILSVISESEYYHLESIIVNQNLDEPEIYHSEKLRKLYQTDGLTARLEQFGYHPDYFFQFTNDPSTTDVKKVPVSGEWAQTNSELIEFLISYFSFFSMVIKASILSNYATISSIRVLIGRIESISRSCEKGIHYLDEYYIVEEIDDFNSLNAKITEKIKESEERLHDIWEHFEQFLNAFIMQATDPSFNLEFFEMFIDEYESFTKWLQPTTVKFDLIGSALGEIVLDLDDVAYVGDFFNRYRGQSLFEDEIEELIEIMGITKKKSEDDEDEDELFEFFGWRVVQEGVQDLMEEIRDCVDTCTNKLQNFDIARQLLERRMMEVDVLLNNIRAENGEVDFESLKQNLLTACFSRLRTQEEKELFHYFFEEFERENADTQEDMAEEGDIIFF